jgi:alkaline phosphatase
MQLRNHPWRPLAVVAATTLAVAGGTATALAVSAGNDDTSAAIAKAVDPAKPKNIIMLVGDGMGESEITAARYYAGVKTRLNIDTLPFRGVVETYSVDTAGKPDYVPDSASTASAWSTGVRTLDGRLSQRPTASTSTPGSNDLPTTFDQAKALGKRTGNVTTAEITDATPAGPSAHMSQRGCQGPANMGSCASERKSAGGLGSIAEQQVGPKHADVILGGGRSRYEQATEAGPTVLDQARTAGFQYAADASALNAVTSLKQGPVLGLFNGSNMTTEFDGPEASIDGGAATCTTTNRPASEPSLDAMTTKSLALLSEDNDKGFFLQVEGASIDKQDHAANPCKQIGETLAFDRAIGTALEYQKAHPDTLVVITADHSHTSQLVSPESNSATGTPTGYYQDLTTADGATLRLAYGTSGGKNPPAASAVSQEHTGASVPVMAVGPQGANVQGVLEQTDLYSLLSFARTPSKLAEGPTTTVPGPTTTVTGPTTTVTTPGAPTATPAVRLTAGVAVPRTLSSAAARRGVPVSLVATKDAKATLTLKSGSRTIAKGTATLKAGRATAGKLSGRRITKSRAAKLKLTVVVTAGKERVTRTATLTVTKR